MKKYSKILTKEFLEREYVEKGRTTIEIGKEIGCNRRTVYDYLIKHKIKILIGRDVPKGENHYRFGENKHRITKEYLTQEYLENKKSMPQIAKELNCGKTMIEFYLNKYNIKLRSRSESLKGDKSSFYIDGRTHKEYHCIDCGNSISYRNRFNGSQRCHSCASKKTWEIPGYRVKVVRASRAATRNKQNKSEKLLNRLLQTFLPKEYKFVGDGKVIIDGFCPDFININGQKKIIEFFGNYWHNKPEVVERDKRRLITYKKYGYKTLIIWGQELKDLAKTKISILKFNKEATRR